jgi:hypothetical protein
VDAYVCWDRVDSAGGNDDRACFCCEVVEAEEKKRQVEVEWVDGGLYKDMRELAGHLTF